MLTDARLENILDKLWLDRNGVTVDRSGSCKFAAVMVYLVHGYEIAGNSEHCFNVTPDGYIFDLNHGQNDVKSLGDSAHIMDDCIYDDDYQDALESCYNRVLRYI